MLFFKEHAVRNSHSSKPVGKTLFILNVPQYYTLDSIKRVFSQVGDVDKVFFQAKPSAGAPEIAETNLFSKHVIEGFQVAYVVYRDAKSVKKAMKHEWADCVFSTEEAPIPTGINKWVQNYAKSFVSAQELQTEVDEFMKVYDEKKEAEERLAKEKEGVPDDEGWVTVSRHSRNAAAVRTETMEEKTITREKQKQSAKKLVNFYSFQIRQSKMEHVANLRQKFEEDKKRIASMKAARRFKPY